MELFGEVEKKDEEESEEEGEEEDEDEELEVTRFMFNKIEYLKTLDNKVYMKDGTLIGIYNETENKINKINK